MKKINILLFFFLIVFSGFAQTVVTAFKITDYVINSNDTISIVQVVIPGHLQIKDKQIGLLKGNFSNGDTSEIGWGRCQLIKDEYAYFGIHIKNKKHLPQKGDLLYVNLQNYPAEYKGFLFKLMLHKIELKKITGENFINENNIPHIAESRENALLDSLVEDIHFTGKAMKQQNDNQDQPIKGGRFDGNQLFSAMQTITKADVKDFLEYIIARPRNYAGNEWAISEIFATWMVGGAPTVIK